MRRLPSIVMLLAQLAAITLFLMICVRTLRNPYPMDYAEGVMLDHVLGLSAGENIYRPSLSTSPYLVTHYPPLFFAVQVPAARMFGPAYWYGRLISQVCALAAACLVAAVVWRMSRDLEAAFATGGMVIGAGILSMWAQYDRVDSLALALGWMGLFLLVAGRSPRVGLAAAFIVAAGFTRHTSWIAPAVAGWAWLSTSGRRPDARRLVLYVVLMGTALSGVLQLLTGGFLWHVLHAATDPWKPFRAVELIVSTEWQVRPTLLLALAGGAAVWFRPSPWGALACGYLAMALISEALSGRTGTAYNYFIEFTTACAMLAGYALSETRTRPALRAAALLLVAWQGALSLHVFRTDGPSNLDDDPRELLSEMRQTRGAVIADRSLGLIPLSGHRLQIQPFRLGLLAETGRWDPTPFISDIEQHRVALAVLERDSDGISHGYFTPGMEAAVVRSLQMCRTLPGDSDGSTVYVLYRPVCERSAWSSAR